MVILQDDYYYEILNDHPVVKTALKKLSTTTAKSAIYKPVEFSNPYSLYKLTMRSKTENFNNTMSAVVLDGYSTKY